MSSFEVLSVAGLILDSLNATPVIYPAISSIVYEVFNRFSRFRISPPTSATSRVIFRLSVSTSSSNEDICSSVSLISFLFFLTISSGRVARLRAALRIRFISSCNTAIAFIFEILMLTHHPF